LLGMAEGCWPGEIPQPVRVPTLQRGQAEQRQMAEVLAQLYVQGLTPDFVAWDRFWPRRKLALPTYPFQRNRYWIETKQGAAPNQITSSTLGLLAEGKCDELIRQLEQAGSLPQREVQTAKHLLEVLYQQHEQERGASSVGDCLYEIGWQATQAQTLPQKLSPGSWLLLADKQGWAISFAELLHKFGQRSRLLYFDELSAPANFERVLEELENTQSPLRHIVQFWSLDLPNTIDAVALDRMQQLSLMKTLEVVQALARRRTVNVAVHAITRGAQAINAGDLVEPLQAPLWGLGRVIHLELPDFQGRLVDLPIGAEAQPSLVEALLTELVSSDDEDQVLLRSGGQRYLARLRRVSERLVSEPLPLRADANYLITGGLGTLGLTTARWLARQGAKNLILVSRRAPTEAVLANIDQLTGQFGCGVEVWQADVSLAEEVERLIARISEGSVPLRGIVHAAGAAGRQPVTELTADDLARVLAAKVRGAAWLHEYTQRMELDFFAGFSSVASVWGSAKQGHYAAANAFLDALMWHRRAKGLVGTALNFGPWAAGGLATAEMRQWLELNGVKLLTSAQALRGWQSLQHKVQGVIAQMDWPRFQAIYQARRRRPFLEEFKPVDQVETKIARTELVERLERAPIKERQSILEAKLRELIGQVLRIDSAQIDGRLGFFDLGMDSLMATEFRQLLERILGRTLSATLAMDQPRLKDLSGYLLTDILALEETGVERVVQSVGSERSANYHVPIAVVGLECRMPGADGAEELWQLLEQGAETITEIPDRRWDIDAYYDPDPEKSGKIYTRHAGLLQQVDQFDASLFGIAPREAVSMDPQQRLLLEVTWEALEKANISPHALARTRTGVYVGASANEYAGLLKAAGLEAIDVHFTTGNALNAIAGRVAFSLGLEGPALVIDTACSSSLVAIHQACQALRTGECDLALAGGVNLLLSPEAMVATCRARMLAPDGRCKTFDAAANGYVRSEGCGMLVLKRLQDAEQDGDTVLAMIRGSAVNQDGATSGLTVPHGPSQVRVIRDALKQAGLEPHEVAYLEAHGTGTNLGDPIEVQAAAAALGQGRVLDRPLLIGSVKTNIGHLEAAAGVAGLIKVILAMRNGAIPKHLHFSNPNPYIPWSQLPVKVTAEATPWPSGRKIAGVSSFGFSGTNAHVIVEEGPMESVSAYGSSSHRFGNKDERGYAAQERTHHVVAFSARNETVLKELARRYRVWLGANPEAEIGDMAYTAAIGRSHLEDRAALVVHSAEEAKQLLSQLEQGEVGDGLFRNQVRNKPKVAWLFTGQGSQYVGMGRELYRSQPAAREVLDRCDRLLKNERDHSLLEVLFERQEDLNHTRYTQPALYALEVALAELLKSWGQEPDIVLGHSVGQYAAAVVAGVLTLEDGLRLISKRAELMGQLPAGGAMAAVFAQNRLIQELLKTTPELSLAADNGTHAVLSGPAGVLERVLASLDQRGVRHVQLNTSHACHSALMEPVLEEFEAFARRLEFRPAERTLICNLTGEALMPEQVLEPGYWRRHIREPVQFGRSVRTLATLGAEMLVEVGPQPELLGMAEGCWPKEVAPQPVPLAILRRGRAEERQMAEVLAQLYVQGLNPDFAAWDRPWLRRKVALPTYPFQRSRYWIETRPKAPKTGHPLFDVRLEAVSGEVLYSSEFGCQKQPWLRDHHLYQTVVVPGATYAVMALCTKELPVELREVTFYESLLLKEAQAQELQLQLSAPTEECVRSFEVHSRLLDETTPSAWVKHASGYVKALAADGAAGVPTVSIEELQRRMAKRQVEEFFSYCAGLELELGPAFRSIEALWQGLDEALGELVVPQILADQSDRLPIHPAVLDACTQVPGAILKERSGDPEEVFYAPFQYGRVAFHGFVPERFFCHVRASQPLVAGSEAYCFDLALITPSGHLVGQIESFTIKRAPRDLFLRALKSGARQLKNCLHELEWREQALESTGRTGEANSQPGTGWWLIATDRKGMGEELTERLGARGQHCVLVDSAAEYQQSAEGRYGLAGNDATAWEQLLKECWRPEQPLAGVVHLWSLDSTGALSATGDALKKDVEHSCASALALAQALLRRDTVPVKGLWFVTQGVQPVISNQYSVTNKQGIGNTDYFSGGSSLSQSPLWGLGKVVALEHPELGCRCVDLSPTLSNDVSRIEHRKSGSDELEALVVELLRSEGEDQIALRGRSRFVARLRPCAQSKDDLKFPLEGDYRLEKGAERSLEGLHFVPIEVNPPQEGEVQVRVHAAGLNFRDVLNALGVYPGDAGYLGGELAGRVTALGPKVSAFAVGDEVMGLAFSAHASRVNVPATLLVRKPRALSFADAATVPVGFITAQVALELVALRKGERVLIHAATGGVGLAAIQLARAIGAEIFATAGASKQNYLHGLGLEHVYDSRSTAFGEQIFRDTNDQGVEVVLNSLTGEGFIEASLRALTSGGRFVEIGKQGIWTAEQMRGARPDVQYEIVALDQQMVQEPEQVGAVLGQLVQRVEHGELQPLPWNLYGLIEAHHAFRQMQQARHVGKIVLEVAPLVKGLDEHGAYLITGGLGGLGLKLARWLVEQGARQLIINGRRAPAAQAEEALAELRQRGVQVEVMLADVAQADEVKRLLDDIEDKGQRLRGIFHLAGVLRDGVVSNQSWQRFEEVLAPKVLGAWYLHQLTLERAPDLFVLFSSVASLLGNQGQSNYAAANMFLDALAHYRRELGLPAVAINWGAWSQTGMAARTQETLAARNRQKGFRWMTPEDNLEALGQVLANNHCQTGIVDIDWKLFGRSPLVADRFLDDLVSTNGEGRVSLAVCRRLEQLPAKERLPHLTTHLQKELAKVLGLSTLPGLDTGFRDLGMDSLLAIEFRNRVRCEFERYIAVPSTVIFDHPNVTDLATYLDTQLKRLVCQTDRGGFALSPIPAERTDQNIPADREGEIDSRLESLSDEEAERLLLEELKQQRED
jgi:acyl transferase domain-containing protein/acyl carrier protein